MNTVQTLSSSQSTPSVSLRSRVQWWVPTTLTLALAVGLAAPVSAQPIPANWLSPASANWNTPAAWSVGIVPVNGVPAGAEYDAALNAGGQLYAVTINSPQTVRSLTLSNANASVIHSAGRLSLTSGLLISGGSYALNGGEIAGGTLTRSGGSFTWNNSAANALRQLDIASTITSTAGSRSLLMDQCTISGSFSVNQFNVLAISGGLSGAGQLLLDSSATLSVRGSQTLNVATVNLTTPPPQTAQPTINSPDNAVLTLGPASVLQGRGTVQQLAGLINQGTIRSTVAGQLLTLSPTSLTNSGVLESTAGTLVLSPTGTQPMVNTGAINLAGGVIRFGGQVSSGTLDSVTRTATGGGAELSGTLDLVNTTWIPPQGLAPLTTISGSRIRNGTLDLRGAATSRFFVGASTTFENVLVLGQVRIVNPNAGLGAVGTTTFAGGAVLGDINATLSVSGTNQFTGGTIQGFGRVATSGQAFLASSVIVKAQGGTLTLGGGPLSGAAGTVNSAATLSADPGATLRIEPLTFNSTGPITVGPASAVSIGLPTTTWSATGPLTLNGGTLTFNGLYTGAVFGQLTRTGGTLELGGEVNLQNTTLSAAGLGGPVIIRDQFIVRDGVLDLASADPVTFTATNPLSSRIRLRNASVLGQFSGVPLLLEGTCGVGVYQARASVDQSDEQLTFATSTNLTTGILRAPSAWTWFESNNNTTLTIGANAAIEGSWVSSQGPRMSLIHRGRLSAGGEQTLGMQFMDFISTGVIEAFAGGRVSLAVNGPNVRSLGGTVTASGSLSQVSFSGQPVTLNNPTLVTTDGGLIDFAEGVDLQGQTFDPSAPGLFVRSKRYKNGTLTLSTSPAPADSFLRKSEFFGSIIMDNVTLNGNATADGSLAFMGTATINGTLRVPGASCSGDSGPATINGTGVITLIPAQFGSVTSGFTLNAAVNNLGAGILFKADTNQWLRVTEIANFPSATLNAASRFLASGNNAQLSIFARAMNISGELTAENGGSVRVDTQPGYMPPTSASPTISGPLNILGEGSINLPSTTVFSPSATLRIRLAGSPPGGPSAPFTSLNCDAPVTCRLVVEGPVTPADWALWPIGSVRRIARTEGAGPPAIQFSNVVLPHASPPSVTGGRRFALRETLSGFVRTAEVIVVPACTSRANVAGPNQSTVADDNLTADDVIVFLGWFFAADSRADIAGANQTTSPDSTFTGDDVIVFLNSYFTGCP